MPNSGASSVVSIPRLRTLAVALSIALAGGAAAESNLAQASPAQRNPSLHQLVAKQQSERRQSRNPGLFKVAALEKFKGKVLQTLPNVSVPARSPTTMVVSSISDSGSGSLRSALSNAVNGDVIDVSHLRGKIVLSSALVPSAAVTIEGPGADKLTIDGGGVDRVITSAHSLKISNVTISGGRALTTPVGGCLFVYGDLYLSNATVTGCTAGSADYYLGMGGAIFDYGNLALKYSTVTASTATGYQYAIGGAVMNIVPKYADHPSGPVQGPLIAYSTISGNTANAPYSAQGGGLIGEYAGEYSVESMIIGSTISGNSATASGYYYYNTSTYAGYVYGTALAGGAGFGSNETVKLVGSTITGNTAADTAQGYTYAYQHHNALAGGLFSAAYYGYYGTYLSVDHSRIAGNTASSLTRFAGAGGLRAADGITTISYSDISGNTALGYSGVTYGGGIFSFYPVTLTNSTLSGNTASTGTGTHGYAVGGGIETFNSFASNLATVTLTNSTVSRNAATSYNLASGGGVYSAYGLTATNCTIANNSAYYGFGGGVYVGYYTGSTTLTSTIVATNTAFYAADIASFNPVTIGGDHNIVISIGPDVTLPGDTIAQDPMLLPLAYNGGPTQTHALDPASPAIDAGSNPLPLTNDQRGNGFPRVLGAAPDIGAFELDPDRIFVDGFDTL